MIFGMRKTGRRIYYGWYVLAALSGISFANGATTIGVLTVFVLPLTQEFGWSRTEIAAATSIGALFGVVAAPITGRLTDKFGARIPLALGSLLAVVAMLSLAAMQSLLWFYLAFGAVRLADQGLLQPPSPPAVAKWFWRYRSRALAVLFFSASAGGVVLPLVVQVSIDTWTWRSAYVMLAGVMLLLGFIPAVLFVRRQPEDMGLSVSQESSNASLQRREDSHEQDTEDMDAEIQWTLSEAAKNPSLWFLLASIFMMSITGSGVVLHMVPYLVQQGLTPTIAVGAVSIGFLAAGVGNLVWGFLAEKAPSRYLLVSIYVLKAISIIVLLTSASLPMAYLYAILQGFTEGGFRTLSTVLLADYYGRQSLGSIFGVSRSVQVSGFAIGPLLSGVVFDITQSYDGAFISFLIMAVIGAFLMLLARRPSKRLKL